MTTETPHTLTMGFKAAELIKTGYVCKCIGVTSRGFFLHFPSNSALFVSKESWRGPLTINARYIFNDITVGSEFSGAKGCLNLGKCLLDPREAAIFYGLPRPQSAPALARPGQLTDQERQAIAQRCQATLKMAQTLKEPSTLEPVLGNDDWQALTELLGLGPGLTPSGDDFLSGIMLLLSYSGYLPRFQSLVDEILNVAPRRTTTLSCCLLKMAAEGCADERILQLMGHLVDNEAASDNFLSWGAHSSVDLLTGALWAARHLLT